MNNDLVSVIVPAYNAEKTIEDCLNSIIHQSYRNLEVIVINDGSTDATERLCKGIQLDDKRIIVHTKENGGVSSARNVGIDLAEGKYIVFVDSDDTIAKTMIEKMVCAFNPGSLVLFPIRKGMELSHEKVFYDLTAFWQLYKMGLLNVPWNKLYERKIIVDNNIRYRNGISIGEDLLFNLDYFHHIAGFMVLPECLYNYYEANNNSLSKKYNKDSFEWYILMYKSCVSFYDSYVNVNDKEKHEIIWMFYKDMQRTIEKEISLNNRENARFLSRKKDFRMVVLNLWGDRRYLSTRELIDLFLYRLNLVVTRYRLNEIRKRVSNKK